MGTKQKARQYNTIMKRETLYEQIYFTWVSGYNLSISVGTDKASDEVTSSFRKYLRQCMEDY